MRKALKVISQVIFNISVFLFGVAIIFPSLMENGDISGAMNNIFGAPQTETVSTGKQPVYYKTWYNGIEDLMAGNAEFAGAAEAEGAVLLKNNVITGAEKALPLDTETDKISLFGVTGYNPMYSLNGAGKVVVNSDQKQYFRTEFEKEGFEVNEELAAWYDQNYSKQNWEDRGAELPNEKGWEDITTDSKTSAGYNTAVVVLGRVAGEFDDLAPYNTGSGEMTDGDFLKLTPNEISLLKGLKAAKDAKHFDRIIVLINVANPLQEEFIDNPEYGIDAALWIGFPGSHGIPAVADILSGSTTPSGRLSSAWYADRKANPNWNYFATQNSVVYQEGIYVGYKYAETRYEDYIMGSNGAGTYDYAANVHYPFGYGLSYTTFSQEIVSVTLDTDPDKNYNSDGELKPIDQRRAVGDDYIVKVKVTNTGSVAGKEVVQLYLQQPYTTTNKQNGVEKPSVELIGFEKTAKLEPGDEETVEIKVDANKYFAAYDITQNKYILDAGTYYLSVGSDSHNAVNNILAKKGYSLNMVDHAGNAATGNAALVSEVEVTAARSQEYEYWTQGGAEVTNLFDHADPNKCDPSGNKITFMSRNNWVGTVSDTVQKVTETTARKVGRAYDGGNNFSESKTNYPYYSNEYPDYGVTLDEPLMLYDMVGVEYDPARGATEEDIQKWDDFISQLTYDELCTLTGSGRRMTEGIDSITKPKTNDVNASNGLNWKFDTTLNEGNSNGQIGFGYRFDKDNRNKYPVGYPCEGIIAATFNKDIAYVVGQAIGEDALWAGVSGLYGFGLNLQRNPYHGRAGEYYSDDPYLTGVMAGYESAGAQAKGLYVYNKHFVLNDQETTRSAYATWITEQALRQSHLRPFEIAIEIGDAMCVMTSFSRIGTYWSGNDYNLMTRCLRGEFGMRGFAVTDWYKSTGMNMTNGLLAGQDLPDGDAIKDLTSKGPGTDNGHLAQAMRISAQRILYTVANSNAMNFYGEGTYQITHEPAWWKTKDALLVAANVIFGLSCVFMVGMYAWNITADIAVKPSKKSK